MPNEIKAKVKEKISSAKRLVRHALNIPDQPPVSRTSSTGELQSSSVGTPELRALDPHNASDISVGAINPNLDVPRHPSERIMTVSRRDVIGSGAKTDPPRFGWSGLEVLRGALEEGTGFFSPLASVVIDISQCIEMFENEAQARKDYEALKTDLDSSFKSLNKLLAAAWTPAMKESVAQAIGELKNEIESVVGKIKRSKTTRLKDTVGSLDEIESFYRRTQHIITQLIICLNTSMLEIANEQITDQRVKNLPDSPSARYHSAQAKKLRRGACMPNTRVQLLQELWKWSQDLGSYRIYWLNGMAGTGKTTIAYSLCEQLHGVGKLGASFFCSRQLPECREVNRIVPSIAYQLSYLSVFRDCLSQVLRKVPDAYNRPLKEQFERLIAAPLRMAGDDFPSDWVVVVDALDECDDMESVDELLELILSQGLALPLRFFVTSRPEAKIRDRMMDEQHAGLRHEIRLHELDRKISQEDIRTYLAVELRRAKVTPTQLDALVARAGVLFIYAATVVRYIGYDNFFQSTTRLKQILSVTGASTGLSERHVDSLYESILEQAMRDPDMEESERSLMADVLGTVVCAREPLSLESIGNLLSLEDLDQVASALRPLGSLLYVPKTTEVVVALHESFLNYMLDVDRSGSFCCMPQKRHASMAHQCLDLIEQVNPPFNICNLESSFVLDDEVPDLEERVRRHISDALSYACCYWAEHIELSGWAADLVNSVARMMEKRLLLWIEVMNLKRYQSQVGVTLSKMMKWSHISECSDNTIELVQDALRFAKVFYMGLAWRSTPHIYISGLTYWSKDRALSRQYAKLIDSGVLATGTAMNGHAFRALGAIRAEGIVRCVVYSPNGAHIVTGTNDCTLRIWDAHTGQQVGKPLTGHTNDVSSIMYSPDGACIASGSYDHTLRIWDAHTGQQMGQPLIGHTNIVLSVAYSPKGTYIVSGSQDCTLCIWDAHTGQQVGQPLAGHTSSISSAVYSPDGVSVVSGSYDCTLRIWDTHTGHEVGEPLRGHTNHIRSVVYSPDGLHIISASSDRSLRIWDAHTGQLVGKPLTGHTDPVYSVSHSPDGRYIVSGSYEGTLRIWKADSGQQVGQPLTGHTDRINSVAYSPDGAFIVSGSYDHTLRIWDAHTGHHVGQLLAGHTDSISSATYSPDGTSIISCSSDRTLCIWDAHTGQQVGEPLAGHTDAVYFAIYSPDGTKVVSCSHDHTLRVWDARTGQQVGKPFIGHTGIVRSAAYSPDGAHIVSGSSDGTLRIWDALTGQQTMKLLTGYASTNRSVVYSPDGAHIVSGTENGLCTWNAYTGQQVGQPLSGHTSIVLSVAYSPDGAYIVSGSYDCTLRIWDARTGQQVGQPLMGHKNRTLAVFSPDGTSIASGSYDSTLCIWDAHTGQQIGQPLRGHTDAVGSVAYSPDGGYIVSSSDDQTLRIWDIYMIQQAEQSSTGPTSTVTTSNPSYDSTYVAVNSPHTALHIRDTATSQASLFIHSALSLPADITHRDPVSQLHRPALVSPQPAVRCFSHCPADRCYCSWTLSSDGWIVTGGNQRLVWVPAELRVSLLRPQNTLLISRYGFLRVDFSRALLGRNWTQCYQPT